MDTDEDLGPLGNLVVGLRASTREFLELTLDTAVEKETITQGQRDAIMQQHDQSQGVFGPR